MKTGTVLFISMIILLSSIGFTYYAAGDDCSKKSCPYPSPTPNPTPTPDGGSDEDDVDTAVAFNFNF